MRTRYFLRLSSLCWRFLFFSTYTDTYNVNNKQRDELIKKSSTTQHNKYFGQRKNKVTQVAFEPTTFMKEGGRGREGERERGGEGGK